MAVHSKAKVTVAAQACIDTGPDGQVQIAKGINSNAALAMLPVAQLKASTPAR
jgi:hypothetical protein